jgi:hypothetical protein
MTYFTTASQRGRVRFGMLPWNIGVTESPVYPERIGEASEFGMSINGLALWHLRVKGADVPGQWVIVDGQFVPVEKVQA